jgi:hypothetical protein
MPSLGKDLRFWFINAKGGRIITPIIFTLILVDVLIEMKSNIKNFNIFTL